MCNTMRTKRPPSSAKSQNHQPPPSVKITEPPNTTDAIPFQQNVFASSEKSQNHLVENAPLQSQKHRTLSKHKTTQQKATPFQHSRLRFHFQCQNTESPARKPHPDIPVMADWALKTKVCIALSTGKRLFRFFSFFFVVVSFLFCLVSLLVSVCKPQKYTLDNNQCQSHRITEQKTTLGSLPAPMPHTT